MKKKAKWMHLFLGIALLPKVLRKRALGGATPIVKNVANAHQAGATFSNGRVSYVEGVGEERRTLMPAASFYYFADLSKSACNTR